MKTPKVSKKQSNIYSFGQCDPSIVRHPQPNEIPIPICQNRYTLIFTLIHPSNFSLPPFSLRNQVIHTESRVHLPAPKRNGGSNGTRIRPNAVGHFGAVNGSHAKAEGARLNGETAKGPKSASNG